MGWLDLAVGTFQLYGATPANLFSLNPSIVRSDWQYEVGFCEACQPLWGSAPAAAAANRL